MPDKHKREENISAVKERDHPASLKDRKKIKKTDFEDVTNSNLEANVL